MLLLPGKQVPETEVKRGKGQWEDREGTATQVSILLLANGHGGCTECRVTLKHQGDNGCLFVDMADMAWEVMKGNHLTIWEVCFVSEI